MTLKIIVVFLVIEVIIVQYRKFGGEGDKKHKFTEVQIKTISF